METIKIDVRLTSTDDRFRGWITDATLRLVNGALEPLVHNGRHYEFSYQERMTDDTGAVHARYVFSDHGPAESS